MSAADRAIRVSTAVAVLVVAGIAAYVSYWHAYEVVRAHGESGVTARLEPATIDGLVYSSSMVVLYAARHRLAVPALARWLLPLGIVATLAANMAHGWSHGPVGAAVAAWPAASLVGSYELLLWLIRTTARAAMVREPAIVQAGGPANQLAADLQLVPEPSSLAADTHATPTGLHAQPGDRGDRVVSGLPTADRVSEPWPRGGGTAYRAADHGTVRRTEEGQAGAVGALAGVDVNAAAVAAYRASVRSGSPLSERKLAAMFGRTSRRWARSRITEAHQAPVPAMAGTE